jgi:hypothetical protein
VDEEDRLAFADFHVVDRLGARQVDLAQVLAPVDLQPLRVGVAVVGTGEGGQWLALGLGHGGES